MSNAYCICSTTEAYKSYVDHWKNILTAVDSKSLWWVIDESKNFNDDPKHPLYSNWFLFCESIVRDNFSFQHNPSSHHFWNTRGDKNIIWFYAVLRMMNFYKSHPNHDYYWFFDDDVRCNNWNDFFVGFDRNTSDFISYFVFKNTNVMSHDVIPTVDHKMHSFNWFSRFPGHGDVLPIDSSDFFGSFFAITRFSNDAMKALIEDHKKGFYGYSEGFVPTVLAKRGMILDTIYRPDNTSDFFDIKKVEILHKNIPITWSWL